MAPHMAASLAPSMTLPPSLSLTLLHPLIAPQGSHQPLLPLLSLCLSPSVFVCLLACLPPSLSHYFHQSFFSLSRAVRLQLHTQGYADMTKRGRKYMLEHTHAHLHKLTFHISLPHCLASPSRFFKKVTVFPLWIPLILFHTTVESFAFQIKKIKKALQKKRSKKKKHIAWLTDTQYKHKKEKQNSDSSSSWKSNKLPCTILSNVVLTVLVIPLYWNRR